MSFVTKLNQSLHKSRARFLSLSLALYGVIPKSFAAGGTNYMEGLKPSVIATFGTGSDIEYYLYLAEGLGAAYGFIKTKNIILLGGLPLLMAFTHWALK